MRHQHSGRVNVDEDDVLLARDRLHHILRSNAFGDDARAFHARPPGVEDQDRYVLLDRRQNRSRMQNLRSEKRQFGRFRERANTDPMATRKDARIRNEAAQVSGCIGARERAFAGFAENGEQRRDRSGVVLPRFGQSLDLTLVNHLKAQVHLEWSPGSV